MTVLHLPLDFEGMNEHKPRHPLGVARRIAGLRQKELAALLGYSLQMVKKVEGGENKISEPMALMAYVKLGVDYDWLMAGDPAKPAKSADANSYTKEDYERVCGEALNKKFTPMRRPGASALSLLSKAAPLLLAAFKYSDWDLACARLHQAVKEIRAQFPGCEQEEARWRDICLDWSKSDAENAAEIVTQFGAAMEAERQKKVRAAEKARPPAAVTKPSNRSRHRVK